MPGVGHLGAAAAPTRGCCGDAHTARVFTPRRGRCAAAPRRDGAVRVSRRRVISGGALGDGAASWWHGALLNSIFLPDASPPTVVCTDAKAVAYLRSLTRLALHGSWEVKNGTIHDWFFAHPLGDESTPRRATRGLARDLLHPTSNRSKFRRVLAVRAPLARFVSAALDKGQRVLPSLYRAAGCSTGPHGQWSNGSIDESGHCAVGGLDGGASELYDRLLDALQARATCGTGITTSARRRTSAAPTFCRTTSSSLRWRVAAALADALVGDNDAADAVNTDAAAATRARATPPPLGEEQQRRFEELYAVDLRAIDGRAVRSG